MSEQAPTQTKILSKELSPTTRYLLSALAGVLSALAGVVLVVAVYFTGGVVNDAVASHDSKPFAHPQAFKEFKDALRAEGDRIITELKQ